MLKSNLGGGCYNYPQKQNAATFHAVINSEIVCVYPWFLFHWYFRGSFSCFKSSMVLVTFQPWLTPVCCCHHYSHACTHARAHTHTCPHTHTHTHTHTQWHCYPPFGTFSPVVHVTKNETRFNHMIVAIVDVLTSFNVITNDNR